MIQFRWKKQVGGTPSSSSINLGSQTGVPIWMTLQTRSHLGTAVTVKGDIELASEWEDVPVEIVNQPSD